MIICNSVTSRGVLVNPCPAKLFFFNFQPHDIVSRYRDPQPQVVENYSNLLHSRPGIYKS